MEFNFVFNKSSKIVIVFPGIFSQSQSIALPSGTYVSIISDSSDSIEIEILDND